MKPKKLIAALKKTANDLNQGCRYEWGHMGRCNVGCLVQNLTGKSDTQIAKSVNFEISEWSEHANDYCAQSNSSVTRLFSDLQKEGLSYKDVIHIEYLSNPKVLKHIPQKKLRRNQPEDVSTYLKAFAKQLSLEHA